MSRDKGQRGEREFFGLLSEYLGTCVRRNVDQVRDGGADCIEVPGWAIEVKRHETGFRAQWWEQALEQAGGQLSRPALAYRASRQPWRVRLLLADVMRLGNAAAEPWIETDIQTFALIVRESMKPVHLPSSKDPLIYLTSE